MSDSVVGTPTKFPRTVRSVECRGGEHVVEVYAFNDSHGTVMKDKMRTACDCTGVDRRRCNEHGHWSLSARTFYFTPELRDDCWCGQKMADRLVAEYFGDDFAVAVTKYFTRPPRSKPARFGHSKREQAFVDAILPP